MKNIIRICFLALALLSIISIISPTRAETVETGGSSTGPPVFRKSWGEGGRLFGYPYGVAVGPNGTVYVADSNAHRVVTISPGTHIYGGWGRLGSESGEFASPTGIALDTDGNVYVADSGNDRIQKFTSDGTYLTQWGPTGNGAGQFWEPHGIAVDSDGNVYVADTRGDRVQKFTADGTYLTQWGTRGSKDGEFMEPVDVAIDSAGNVYVADSRNDRIQKFTPDGVYLSQWGKIDETSSIFFTLVGIDIDVNDNVYVTDWYSVKNFTTDGTWLDTWVVDGLSFYGVAVDGKGNVYVSDSENKQVQVFDADGNYLVHWGGDRGFRGLVSPKNFALDGNGHAYVLDDGIFETPIRKFTVDGTYVAEWGDCCEEGGEFIGGEHGGIAVGKDGNVYLADTNNNRIHKFSADGAYLAKWGELGSEEGQFNVPADIAVDSEENIYVADKYNSRIQKFTPDGTFLHQWSNVDDEEYWFPTTIALDKNDNVYVGEDSDYKPYGNIRVFTSNGDFIGMWKSLSYGQYGLAVDGAGNVYLSDWTRVLKFTADGTLLAEWGSTGNGPGQFNYVAEIAVDDNGDIYVEDMDNGRVQVFSAQHPAPDSHSGLLNNGSFEESATFEEWTTEGTLPISRAATATHGQYSLQLGDAVEQKEQGLGEAWAHQTIYVDPAWAKPQLSFQYRMFVNDIMDYSDFLVTVKDGVGLNHLATALRDGYQPCIPGLAPRPGTDLGWRSATYDLSAFKGQYVRIVFSNRNLWPISYGIWSFVDDVRVIDVGADNVPPGREKVFLSIIRNEHCDPVAGSRNVHNPAAARVRPPLR